MFFWREAGAGVRGEQGGQRQLTSSKGPERKGIHHHEQGTAFPREFFLSFYSLNVAHPLSYFARYTNKKGSLCRLKINHASGSKSCVYSWYTGLHSILVVSSIYIQVPPPCIPNTTEESSIVYLYASTECNHLLVRPGSYIGFLPVYQDHRVILFLYTSTTQASPLIYQCIHSGSR
jgi:hypothetical protein